MSPPRSASPSGIAPPPTPQPSQPPQRFHPRIRRIHPRLRRFPFNTDDQRVHLIPAPGHAGRQRLDQCPHRTSPRTVSASEVGPAHSRTARHGSPAMTATGRPSSSFPISGGSSMIRNSGVPNTEGVSPAPGPPRSSPRSARAPVREVPEPEPVQPPPTRLEEVRQRLHFRQRPQVRPDQIAPPPHRPRRGPPHEAGSQRDDLGPSFDSARRSERQPRGQTHLVKGHGFHLLECVRPDGHGRPAIRGDRADGAGACAARFSN